jgi:hypothetical protein
MVLAERFEPQVAADSVYGIRTSFREKLDLPDALLDV